MSVPPPTSPEPARNTSSAAVAAPDPRVWSRTNMARLYDLLVIHGTYRWLWHCPWPHVARLYAATIQPGDRVLEIGPGSGFFLNRLNRCDLRVDLLDLNEGSLQASAARLARRYAPTTHQHDALTPFPLEQHSVDVVAMSMVLHCLPGASIAKKAVVFDHIATVLRPGTGVCIGATVLSSGVDVSPLGRAGLRRLNTTGIFCNTGDTLSDLSAALHNRFAGVHLAVAGSVALWQVSTR